MIMKKKALLFILIVLSVSAINAQAFQHGDNVVSAGIGLGSSILNYSGSTQSPAISLQYENGTFPIKDVGIISLGGYVGFKTYSYDYGAGAKAKWTYTIIGARGAFHVSAIKVKNLDVYGGVMLSYNYLKYKDAAGYSTGAYGSAAGFTAYAGSRYYFSKNIGAFAELGYGVSYLTLGVALKF